MMQRDELKFLKDKIFENITISKKSSTEQVLYERMMLVGEMPVDEDVDWEGDFRDVFKTCWEDEEFKDYLNFLVERRKKKPSKREKLKTNKPHIHVSPLTGTTKYQEEGEIDVDAFIDLITTVPEHIIKTNQKAIKSETEDTVTYDMGIPAWRGLIYDFGTEKFYIVGTCPGAGKCLNVCYARKGSYIMFPNVFIKQTQVLNLLMNDPEKFKQTILNDIRKLAKKRKHTKDGKKIMLRWNDAGDFFSEKYFQIANEVTNQIREEGYDFDSYGYTKIGDRINFGDSPITLNWSDDANKRERSKVDPDKVKGSKIELDVSMLDDLFVKNEKGSDFATDPETGRMIPKDGQSYNLLKHKIAKKHGLPFNSLKMYHEIIKTPPGNEHEYNVIVLPKGDGDIGAQRKDVFKSILMFH
jgi:hypothetical protein